MKYNNNTTRVAELSATLQPITNALTFLQFSEVVGMAEDFISYNSPYYCNGLQRVSFDTNIHSCIFQKADNYQVLRFFATHVYNSGEGMFQYYANELANRDNDNYMDDGEYDDELELEGITEYKQIFVDRKGHTSTIILNPSVSDTHEQIFCSVHSMHDWVATTPKAFIAILALVNEYDDYAYTYPDEDGDIVLKDLHNTFLAHMRTYNAEFTNEIAEHGFTDKFIHYHRTFKVLHKHHIQLPTGYEQIRIYFNQLDNLERQGRCLTEPANINPTDLIAKYQEEQDRLAHEREEKAKQLAQQEEARFNREHAYLFGIQFDNDHFRFQSLDSVEAYRIEGDIMHHCIFRSKYYNMHDVLSLHITDMEGNRVATCSINVMEGKIVQLQTMCNEPTWKLGDEYKEIWNVLMARMHTFPRRRTETNKQLKIA